MLTKAWKSDTKSVMVVKKCSYLLFRGKKHADWVWGQPGLNIDKIIELNTWNILSEVRND